LAGFWRSQRGAVIFQGLGGGREGGTLGSLSGCRHSNQTEQAGPLSILTSGKGNNPGFPYLELISETTTCLSLESLVLIGL
jgi:hypothetical protein